MKKIVLKIAFMVLIFFAVCITVHVQAREVNVRLKRISKFDEPKLVGYGVQGMTITDKYIIVAHNNSNNNGNSDEDI